VRLILQVGAFVLVLAWVLSRARRRCRSDQSFDTKETAAKTDDSVGKISGNRALSMRIFLLFPVAQFPS
jgi:hypothetical protein